MFNEQPYTYLNAFLFIPAHIKIKNIGRSFLFLFLKWTISL